MVEMTWQEIQAGANQNAVVLLPIGMIEAHGPHMDLSPDFYLGALICRFLKQELQERSIEALITPPVYWGISPDIAQYAGTFSVRPETMKGLLIDILASIKSWGFRKVFITNCHGDQLHLQTINEVIEESNKASDFMVYAMWNLDVKIDTVADFPPMREDRYQPDYHAGAIETAQVAAFFPEKVRCDIAKSLLPQGNFHPLAYCGDPASYHLEYNFAEYVAEDMRVDALKIEAILKRDGFRKKQ